MGAPASPQVVGRYAMYGKIASGGFASVHFGRLLGAAGFSRSVAIKRLHTHLAEDPAFLSVMIDEARLAARIHHPNVVPTLDVVSADGELLVVMEYVRGESLARLIWPKSGGERRIPPSIASAIAVGALHGLHAAHEATSPHGAPLGIVHRDVSPQNILVGVDGVARVIDFGVAKAAGRLQTTRAGEIKGKRAYMAPEQFSLGEVTRAADVYAMGVVLWEVLAGRRLFKGDNDAQFVVQVMAGVQDPPSRHAPNLPAGLDDLVMTALARDPADRFASAQDMAAMLLRVVPPAFPTTVGKWVQEAASEAIERRGTELAEIESYSGVATVVPVPTIPDTMPPGGGGRLAMSSRGIRTAMGVLLAAGVLGLMWSATTPPGAAESAAPAEGRMVSSANLEPVAVNAPPPPTAVINEEPGAPPPVASRVAAPLPPATSPPVAHPAAARPRPRSNPAPKPAAPFRFAQPD
jgi:serine/threonine-protein kinase